MQTHFVVEAVSDIQGLCEVSFQELSIGTNIHGNEDT